MTIQPEGMFGLPGNAPSYDPSQAAKRVLNANVAQVNPALYSAGSKINLTREERNLIESWSTIKGAHEKLMAMNNKKADENFKKLHPDIQNELKKYYKVDYANKADDSVLIENPKARELFGIDNGLSIGDAFKSPFRWLLAGTEQYMKLYNTPISAAQNAAINREDFWSRSNFEASFDGDFNYDQTIMESLVQKHGREVSFAAMHLLAGKTPGEIIDAWGPNDGAILEAVNKVFNEPEEISLIMDDFDRARLSPGRNVARWVNKSFDIDAEEHPDWFKNGSGLIDGAFQIFADPLTYLSAGLINVGKVGKLSKALRSSRDVVEHFNQPEVIRYFTSYGEKIGEYKKAVDAKDSVKAAEIKDTIRRDHRDHGTDVEIRLWSESGVVDFKTIRDQFVGAPEYFSKLIQGKVVGNAYSREAAAVATPAREFAIGAKEKVKEFFVGKTDWDALDKVGAEKLLSDMAEAGLERSGKFDFTEIDDMIRKTASTGLRKFIQRMSAMHPGNKGIFFDDFRVDETLETLRSQTFIALGDKRLAHLFVEHFRTSTEMQRIALKRSVDELTLRKVGIHGMPGGEQFIKQQLDFHYGSVRAMAAGDATPKPSAWNRGSDAQEVVGALHPFQFKNAIGSLDWQKISQFVAKNHLQAKKEFSVESVAKTIGGIFNNKFVEETTSNWSLLTLVPQLGIRTSVDEGFFFALTAKLGVLKEWRTAKRIGNITTAVTGDVAATGPLKNALQILAGKVTGKEYGAVRAITQVERDALITKGYDTLGQGGFATKAEADAAIDVDMIDLGIEKYGAKLTDLQKKYLHQKFRYNPNVLSQVSASNLVDALLGYRALHGSTGRVVSKSNLDLVREELGVISSGLHHSIDLRDILDADIHKFMFNNFIEAFSSKGFSYRGKFSKNLDPARLFLANNSLRTEQDLVRATNQFLKGLGFEFNGAIWQVPTANVDQVKTFLNSTTQMSRYDGLPDVEKATLFIEDVFTDLYTRFHGTTGKFNEDLHAIFKPFRGGFIPDHRMIVRDIRAGEAVLQPSGLVKYPSYKDMVQNNLVEGSIVTDLDFHYGTNLESWHRRFRAKSFEMMSRQTDDIYRQPAVDAYYMAYRKESELEELAYAKKLYEQQIKAGVDPAIAKSSSDDIAAIYFTNQQMERAVNQVLKYADNPEMRTVFAYNVRTVGRFYRAVEDFHRRMYRLVKDNKLSAVYRGRLLTQGINSYGEIHEDTNGEQYVILPMDDLIYSAVDGTLRALTGNTLEVKQPLFNDISFKLTAANPSFQTDAGVPYLSGPAGALSVLAVKSLLGKFDYTKVAGEKIDDMFLGNFGSNITLASAVTPKFVSTMWKMLSPDERSQQEISAFTQALSYNQANGYEGSVDPLDYAKDGVIDEAGLDEAKRKYLADVKISAHNILVVRGLLGLMLPFAVQTRDTKDMPSYLKDNGVVSMKASFYEVLDQVKLKYPDVSDPYELALATWMGKNPGKVVYLASTNQEGVKPLLKYSNAMQTWAIQNQADIERYGAGALMFAPYTGEFTPGIYQWAEAADLVNNIPANKTATQYISDYYTEVMLKQHVNAYYEIADREEEDLRGVSFANANLRRASINAYTQERTNLKLSVPGLENYLKNGTDNTDAFDFVQSAYNYANSSNAKIDPKLKTQINEAYNIYNEFIQYANQITMIDPSNGADLKRAEKDKAVALIQKLIDADSTKVMQQYYDYGLRKLMNAKSRDANVTINRNVIK